MTKNVLTWKLLIYFIVLTLAGCSLHSLGVKEPVIDIPTSFSVSDGGPSLYIGKWWEQFEDEELNVLMEEALRHNLDIKQAYERLRQMRAVLGITGSSRGPVISIGGAAGRARQPGMSGSITSDSYSMSASASYEIDLWRKLSLRTEAARLDALASEQDLKALYISISARLADLYYLAVEQRAQLELSDQTIASFKDTLERVERRYFEGLVPAIDVYQSRQNLAAARAQRPLFKASLSVALNAVSVLTGDFPHNVTGGSIIEFKDAPVTSVGIPSQILIKRPDVEAAILRLRASDERVGEAIANMFPSFNLIGSYGGSSDKLKTLLDSPNVLWNLLLQIAQPIIDSGKRRAEVDRSKAVFREHLAIYHKTVINAFREVEDALAQISASEERIRMLGESVSVSESALQLSLNRYLQGLSDYLPVLTAQPLFFTAKSNLLSERRKLVSYRIQLVRSLGGEWMDEAIEKYLITEDIGEKKK